MTGSKITFRAVIARKDPALPRYIVVPADQVQDHGTSFTAEVWLNEAGPFRRNIHPWGKGRPEFFFNLTAPQCAKAGLEAGDDCLVTIRPVTPGRDPQLPEQG